MSVEPKNIYTESELRKIEKELGILVKAIADQAEYFRKKDIKEKAKEDIVQPKPKKMYTETEIKKLAHESGILITSYLDLFNFCEHLNIPLRNIISSDRVKITLTSLENDEKIEFPSISEAARSIGKPPGTMNYYTKNNKKVMFKGKSWIISEESRKTYTEKEIQKLALKSGIQITSSVTVEFLCKQLNIPLRNIIRSDRQRVTFTSQDGEIKEFPSQHEAARESGKQQGNINYYIKKKKIIKVQGKSGTFSKE